MGTQDAIKRGKLFVYVQWINIVDTEGKCLDTCEQTLLGDLAIGERTPCAAQDHYGVIKERLCRRRAIMC